MSDSGQPTSSAAEVYDEFFVPAFLGAPSKLVAAARGFVTREGPARFDHPARVATARKP